MPNLKIRTLRAVPFVRSVTIIVHDFFASDEEGGAYVSRQPESDEEAGLYREQLEGCPLQVIGEDG